MNKQEAIDELENAIPDFILNDFQRGKETGLTYALELVNQLDELEKPVVPQFVADWLEVCKENLALSLASSMNNIVMRTNNQPDKTIHWLAKNSETFAKAWLFGYEVEKEELYTAELMSTGEYLHYDIEADKIHHFFAYGNTAKNSKYYHFTKSTLIQYNAWGNNAYDVNEVEE